ncbi:MAG: tRNA threonylcarbamoyladenosine dehydratase [Deltaproteobacteria bacterium]|nr:tRNA threonylcarbamoyladenosine dehydratase [Deltaproteobacteria bacterium]
MDRFSRVELIFGVDKFRKIRESSIAIFGLGAVGYMAAEALIRTGIGNLTIVDFDILESSDFNRHLLATEENIGMSKVEVAKRRLMSINNNAVIEAKEIFFHMDTADQLFQRKYDFLIDAIDSLHPKVELIKYCLKIKQPFISVMGAARRLDPSLIKISTINKGQKCRLLKHVRRLLRKECVYDDFPIVYSEENAKGDIIKASTMYYVRGRIRDIIPSCMIVTSTFGLFAAYAAVKFLVEKV